MKRGLIMAGLVLLLPGCGGEAERAPAAGAVRPARADGAGPAALQVQEGAAPARFRPVGFTDTTRLWGLLRGRVAVVELPGTKAEALDHSAWSIVTAPGRVSWRNETGLWGMTPGEAPRRLAPTELMPGYDGPPDVLWSQGARRAVLSWAAEWDYHHELLAENGERAGLATAIDGYMLDRAVLWLDRDRVLFEVVANGPRGGGEPEYRESGWRGDLAVLDVESGEFEKVTDVADGSWLRPVGLMADGVLVREHGAEGVRTHWLYHPGRWTRRELALPRGRTWAAGDAIVSYAEEGTERWRVRLIAAGVTTELGIAADPDLAPALSPDGRRIALRVLRGGDPVVLLIRR